MDPRWFQPTPPLPKHAPTLVFDLPDEALRSSREFEESEELDALTRREPVKTLTALFPRPDW